MARVKIYSDELNEKPTKSSYRTTVSETGSRYFSRLIISRADEPRAHYLFGQRIPQISLRFRTSV